ncbi:LacI family DNA-binding transcriptional regulator [Jannaschia rubra]|uniref:Putative galacturonate locus repressor n=1 Tax=Jannaschia rubra TaxID=282197 RepID=A0A0M6XSA2_9RHOB|nr:LacI family DNA-binding transcriptional regulator [Jannaschia rubra]CTQ34029.1 putative galacturonate locus repressor [Jannaschia rubra]SFG24794.1 transcriptional regulator, LacI family [Jannaschia rubra]
MTRKKVTSLDVARMAGVSQSAVSRVFTEGASVSGEMDRRVRAAAEELGYRPNALARGLITGRTRIIGLVVAYLDNPFYPDAIEKLSHALQEKGYHLLIFTTGKHGIDTERVISDLLDYQVDGIVTASIDLSNELTRQCARAGIPVVLFNRGIPGSGLAAVTSDNLAGGRKAAEFLLAGGHARIAHIAGFDGAQTSRDRLSGFRTALESAGQGLHALADGRYDREAAAQAARDMMDRADPPDAIFVSNDHMALAVMDVLRFDLGLCVPEDVSIVGYDDVPMAAWPAYDLTTVRQPTRRMVDATVTELMTLLDRPNRAARVIQIDGPLVVRGSARIPEGYET